METKKLALSTKINVMVICVIISTIIISTIVFAFDLKSTLDKGSLGKVEKVLTIADNTIQSYIDEVRNGNITEQQAKAYAINFITTYNKNNPDSYVWINDYNVKFLANPTRPVGSDGSIVKDPDGKTFYKDLAENARRDGEATEEYKWVKAGGDKGKYYPKISKAKHIPEFHWIIATGAYKDDYTTVITKSIINIIIVNSLLGLLILFIARLLFTDKLTNELKYVSTNLDKATNDIETSTNDMDEMSQALAEGSNEQASSVQEIAATVEETVSMIQKNDENSRYAAELSKKTRQNTASSYEKMNKLMESMDKINESSKEISKIIKVIDEIAFQTNILALNAAVEAARAGDAGKGFAVVAEEVRNLAQRSTASAKDTTALIAGNITLYQQSDELAKDVHASVASIDEDINKVNELIQEVATATHEQQIGIEQIHAAIAQVEQVLQNNTLSAEGTATSAHQMKELAEALKEITKNMEKIISG